MFSTPAYSPMMTAGSCSLQVANISHYANCLNNCSIYLLAKRNGMNNNERAQVTPRWKTGPQLLLGKHIFFFLFFHAFMRTSIPCRHWGRAPLLSLQYTLFGIRTASYSLHPFKRPYVFISMAHIWLDPRCLLHVLRHAMSHRQLPPQQRESSASLPLPS